METAFLANLKKAVDENQHGVLEIGGKAAPLTVEPRQLVGISKDVDLRFDAAGNAQNSVSLYCPINVSFTGFIRGLNAVFTIVIDTNFPQHFRWDNVVEGQKVSGTIRTNVFSNTKGTLTVHSSVPNAAATLHGGWSFGISKPSACPETPKPNAKALGRPVPLCLESGFAGRFYGAGATVLLFRQQ